MGKVTNEFSAGMDQDSSKNKYDNRHYYDANNIRILTQDGITSGALEDMEGTIKRLDLSGTSSNPVIIVGYCILRDDIIIFLTENVSGPPNPTVDEDFIIKVPIVDIENLAGTSFKTINPAYVQSGGNVIYKENLGFSTENPILAIPRYETESIQKVYWVDGYNKLRYLNVIYDADTNDLTTLPPDRLEVLGDIELTQPTLDAIVGGNLRSGRIQYGYQLYALNGGETVFSPLSNLVNLTESSVHATNTEKFAGSFLDDNTNKGVRMEVDITSLYYSRIRIVAVHWTTLYGDPEIRIVAERQIDPAGGIIEFTDTGESLGSYTIEEIRLLQTTLFSAELLETKNNILFAGNVIIDDFDVEYDARAYRFRGNSRTNTAYNYVDNAYTLRSSEILADGVAFWYIIDGTQTPPTVVDYLSTPIGDWTDIPEDFDAVNPFNWLASDGAHNYKFMFQSNGTTIGGDGPNVKYEFVMSDTLINEEPADNAFRFYTENYESAANPSYPGYASPWNAGDRVGYHRDEIYRFGIVFFDEKGRSSFVKWIGDIRFPSISTKFSDTPTDNYRFCTDLSQNRTEAHILYIEFTVDNIPTEAESFQIVRVMREGSDRSVLAQGIGNMSSGTGQDRFHKGWRETASVTETFQFHSPEVAFNKNLVANAGDYLQVVATAGDEIDGTLGTLTLEVTRYVDYDPLLNPQALEALVSGNEHNDNNLTTFLDSTIVTQDSIAVVLNGVHTYTVNNATNKTDKGINFVCIRANASWEADSINYDAGIKLLNYRREVKESRFGGQSYNARALNEYIAAGPIEDKTGFPIVSDVFGGDTYVGFFDCLYNSHENQETKGAVMANAIYFPVETSINMEYRLDDCYHKVFVNTDSSFIHDLAGLYTDTDPDVSTPTIEYLQLTDYYLHNNVYSKENTGRLFVPKPFDWEAQTKFDVRVYASDQKINGEVEDSWLKFRTDAFIEVDPQYGPLTVLKTVTNKLTFFQPQAFGTLSVNEQALLQTQDIAQLSLGISGILDRYDYAKTDVGCFHWRHLLLTPNALYWTDIINQSMFMFTKGPEEVSLMKGMNSWFRDNILEPKDFTRTIDGAMYMFYDPEYREVYLVDNTEQFGLIYNELTNGYTCFTDNQPFYVINYLDKVLGTSGSFHQWHRHNDFAGSRGHLYGSYREISVTLLINPAVSDIGVFNNFEWLTEIYDSNVDQALTWESLTMWNDYQHTGTITLTVGGNIKRRMRKWRFTVPRALYQSQQGVQGAALTERYARMRDSHIFAKFSYLNDTADRRFTIHDITTSVTISNN